MQKLRDEKKVLDEALVTEQKKVTEMRELIDEAKEAMAAQNQEISNRIAQKEQRETQVMTLKTLKFKNEIMKLILLYHDYNLVL